MTSFSQNTFAGRARHLLAQAAHDRATKAHAARRSSNQAAPQRDWGTSNGSAPLHWQAVDALACRTRVAVTYHAEFDAVSLSAGPGMHSYADTPESARCQIAALVHARDGGR